MHIVLLKCPHVQIAFLKFTSCDNQAFARVYSNSCSSCSFEPKIIRIGQSSHKMYSNNILNFQESTIILKACTKKVWKLIECTTYIICQFCLGVCSLAVSMPEPPLVVVIIVNNCETRRIKHPLRIKLLSHGQLA